MSNGPRLPSSSSPAPRLPRSSRSAMAKQQPPPPAPDSFPPTTTAGAHGPGASRSPDADPATSTAAAAAAALALPSSGSNGAESSSSHSLISPLSLSRITSQSGYFDTKPASASHGYIYSPLSAAVSSRPPHFTPQSYLAPRSRAGSDALTGGRFQPRLSGFSPPIHSDGIIPRASISAVASSPSYQPLNGDVVQPQSRSVSADGASAVSSTLMIRRLSQQNGRIREAWEAERKYMEANRERVEEVYKEERAIMEAERTEWENEKTVLLEEIQRLRQRVSGLETDSTRLQAMVQRLELEKAGKVAGVSVTLPGVRGSGDGSTDMSFVAAGPSHPTLVAANDLPSASFPLINGLRHNELPGSTSIASQLPDSSTSSSQRNANANAPHHGIRGNSHTNEYTLPRVFSPGGSRISPSKQPEGSSPFIPRAHNMQPISSPPVDFLASPKDEDVPIIDIQIIHPELEGIPLRAPAVQRETFADSGTEGSKASSSNTSPPDELGHPLRRGSSKDQTLEVLAAPAPARLVMHAGHTPSHSLSNFPTVTATEVGTVVDGSTGHTPTSQEPPEAAIRSSSDKPKKRRGTVRIEDNPAFELEASAEEHPEPVLEAEDDDELKGPLMIRNIPAQDEIFFRRLSEKLEDVSRSKDAVPTCLQDPVEEAAEAAESSAAAREKENMRAAGPVEVDGTNDEGSDCLSGADEELEIPLKLKKTTNFGAPLGVMS